MPSYQTFDVPENVQKDALSLLQQISKTGKIKKGTNEVIKAIERSKAKLVYIALDVDPEEIVAILPPLCDEKKIPYIFIDTKKDLGISAGTGVSTASTAVIEAGKSENELKQLIQKIATLRAESSKPQQEQKEQQKPDEQPQKTNEQ